MKPFFIAAFALAVLSLQPVASAQVSVPFMTIDGVAVGTDSITVTGVVQGNATPEQRTVTFMYGTDGARSAALGACHRQLLLALSKPGQYLVQAGPNLCNVALAVP